MLCRILALATVLVTVAGHGRVTDPPSRASMWRKGFPTKPNYDDHGLNCGGFGQQYSVNDGRCGICGDAWNDPVPRSHELGGEYGTGIIVAEYQSGQIFTAEVDITVYHKGYWIFKICPDPNSNDQSCFDEYPIELEEGGTEFYPPSGGIYKVNYRLPEDLICDHCVLQWRYKAGNSWGVCSDGRSELGCGDQENFYACSDISIKASDYVVPEVMPLPLEVSDGK